MKRIVLALALAAISGAAMAEWVALGSSDKMTHYADPATIRRSGDMVKMWGLYDFKSPQPNTGGAPYLSAKQQLEVDCKEERVRSLYGSAHSKDMGAGNVLFSYNVPDAWSPVPPGSIAETQWKFACGKN